MLTALTAFLPSMLGWSVAPAYHRIPRFRAAVTSRVHETAPGAPPLVGAEAVGAAPDGTLFVADWTLRHVLAVRPPAAGRWLPPVGRFVPRVGADGKLRLLDVDSGLLHRFSAERALEARVAVAPPGSSPLFCLAPDGRVLVAAGGWIRRFTADRMEVDPSWGPAPHAVPAPGANGLAVLGDRVYAASSNGFLFVYSGSGELLKRESLLGNAGALAAGPDGGLVLADRPTGRLFLLGADGRTAGRLVSASGTTPVASPADLVRTPDGTLAVAAGESLDLVRLTGEAR